MFKTVCQEILKYFRNISTLLKKKIFNVILCNKLYKPNTKVT